MCFSLDFFRYPYLKNKHKNRLAEHWLPAHCLALSSTLLSHGFVNDVMVKLDGPDQDQDSYAFLICEF